MGLFAAKGKKVIQQIIYNCTKNIAYARRDGRSGRKIFNANPALMAIISVNDKTFIDINQAWIDKLKYSIK